MEGEFSPVHIQFDIVLLLEKTVWKQYLLYSTRFSTPYTTVVYMKIGQEAAEITMFISILYKVYFVKI